MTPRDKTKYPTNGWLLYDARCGFCSQFIPKLSGLIDRAGYLVTPIQSEWILKKLETSEESLNRDIRILTLDDKLISGVDVYLTISMATWWTKPIGLMLSLPGLYQIAALIYRLINQNRYIISNTCKLTPDIRE